MDWVALPTNLMDGCEARDACFESCVRCVGVWLIVDGGIWMPTQVSETALGAYPNNLDPRPNKLSS